MTDLFISDLHLDEQRPQITQLFLDFLARDARGARALYILGDLFEAWIGDDHDTALSQSVADGLAGLRKQGTQIAFLHGNRDFLLGEHYAERCGMELLQEPTLITLGQDRILLSHGDTLCTDDHAYQSFRRMVRQPEWQRAFLDQPIEKRLNFAQQARSESSRHTSTSEPEIMDVNADAVRDSFLEHQMDILIHGHTHRPNTHQITVDGRPCRRIVLGDWYEQGSVLYYEGGDFRLKVLAA